MHDFRFRSYCYFVTAFLLCIAGEFVGAFVAIAAGLGFQQIAIDAENEKALDGDIPSDRY